MPRAEFWRVWVVSAMLVAVAIAAFTGMDRAHGQTMRKLLQPVTMRRVRCPAPFHEVHRRASLLRFGTRLRVCPINYLVVTITDRGPALRTERSLDLSRGAALDQT